MIREAVGRVEWSLDVVRQRCIVDGDCWTWTMGCTGKGVPQARINGKCTAIARYVVNLTRKAAYRPPLRPNQVLKPHCGNPRCVGPQCLYLETRQQVLARLYQSAQGGLIRNKQRRSAIARGHTVLDAAGAARIRAAQGSRAAHELAREHGITPDQVRCIWRGKSWAPLGLVASVFAWGEAA